MTDTSTQPNLTLIERFNAYILGEFVASDEKTITLKFPVTIQPGQTSLQLLPFFPSELVNGDPTESIWTFWLGSITIVGTGANSKLIDIRSDYRDRVKEGYTKAVAAREAGEAKEASKKIII